MQVIARASRGRLSTEVWKSAACAQEYAEAIQTGVAMKLIFATRESFYSSSSDRSPFATAVGLYSISPSYRRSQRRLGAADPLDRSRDNEIVKDDLVTTTAELQRVNER